LTQINVDIALFWQTSLSEDPWSRHERAVGWLIAIGSDSVETRYFSTAANEVEQLAGGLIEAGTQQGEPVGIYAEGGPDWIVAFLAIIATGAVAVPFDVSLKGEALAELVRDSGCQRFFVARREATDLQDSGVADGTQLYLLGDGTNGTTSDLTPWRNLTAAKKLRLPVLDASDQAALFYTSGTTGLPKGVPLTHGNLVANVNSLVAEHMVASGDRVLLPLPPHHVYPLVVGVLAPLASGAGIVFPAGISGPQIVDALHRGDASVLIGVPRLYSARLDAIDARLRGQSRVVKAATHALFTLLEMAPDSVRRRIGKLVFRRVRAAFGPRLRLLASGGAHLDAEIWRALERFGWAVSTGYGLTETAPILAFNPLKGSKIGSAGKAIENVELRIAAADNDGVGEIEARGPNVFAGYRDRPQETEAAFTSDGWFRTGDLGRLDDDGYLYIVGRVKELIVLPDGKNVFPETIEAVYGSSPLIREIAVLEHGSSLVGLVVPDLDELRKRGAESAVQLVRDEIRDLSPSLPPYQRLSGHVLTRTSLPRTAIGKLRRHQLPDLYQSASSGTIRLVSEMTKEDRSLLSTSRASEVWDWLNQRFPGRPLSLDVSPQLDLGVDSLGWTGLSLEIEDRFGVSLSEETISRIVTLRDLIHAVIDAAAIPSSTDELALQEAKYLAPPTYMQRLFGAALYGIFRLTMRLFFRLRVTGLENVPKAGPFIIAANHASWLDPIAIAAALSYDQIRQTRFAGWTGVMFGNVVARVFSWAAGVFPVNPDRAPASSLALARVVLDQKGILVWFPEGRRTTTGSLQNFQPGIGALLEGSTVPVVPAYITGTFEAAPAGRRIPRFTPIEVRFGAPQTAAILVKGSSGEAIYQQISNALHDAVSRLAGPGS
jgi:long-chain acyl-CoA synthetase